MVNVSRAWVEIVSRVAGKRVQVRHDLSKPQGVRGRNSDNSRLRLVLHWEPGTLLEEGLRQTYLWISAMLEQAGRLRGEFSTVT